MYILYVCDLIYLFNPYKYPQIPDIKKIIEIFFVDNIIINKKTDNNIQINREYIFTWFSLYPNMNGKVVYNTTKIF